MSVLIDIEGHEAKGIKIDPNGTEGEHVELHGLFVVLPKKLSDVIDVVKLKDSPVTKGMVSFETPWTEDLGLKKGDVVGFRKNMDYRIKIDDVEYYRVRAEDLMYVEK